MTTNDAPNGLTKSDDNAVDANPVIEVDAKGIRPTPQSQQKIPARIASSSFSGPLPPPSLLGGYENVSPGLADRIVAMTERESAHRQEIEKTVVNAQAEFYKNQFAEAKRGQLCALAITLAGLGTGLYAALNGHEITGGILGVGGIGGIVASFILGRGRGDRSDDTAPPKSQPKYGKNGKKKQR